MNSKHLAICLYILVIVALVAMATLVSGCGGGCSNCDYGGAQGWIYQPIGGGQPILSGSPNPPAGYEPVPAGTVVSIVGYPDLQTTTDENGYYLILQIPAGQQVIRFATAGGTGEYNVLIIAGQITTGGGHSEGGS